MPLVLIAEADTISGLPLRRQYNDWRFYHVSIS